MATYARRLVCGLGAAMVALAGLPAVEARAQAGSAVEGIAVVPDLAALRSGAFELRMPLPDRGVVAIEPTGVEHRGGGDLLWRGRVVGQPESQVQFTVRRGFAVGSVHAFGADYQLVIRGGQHRLERLDASRRGDALVATAPPDPASGGAERMAAALAVGDPAGETEIDVLVIYTTVGALGSHEAMQATVQGWVDYANTVFVNSQVAAHYRLLDIRYEPALQFDFAQGLLGGRPATVLRDAYGADIVALVVSDSQFAQGANPNVADGVAPIYNLVNEPIAQYSFHFTKPHSQISTFAHESGHVLGMGHEPDNPDMQGVQLRIPWAFGHYVPGVFGTVMSYHGPTIPHFSNPDVIYQGHPTGIPGQRDNAAAARQNGPPIAAFRTPGPLTPPTEAPTGLNAVVSVDFDGSLQVNLVWFPTPGASGYEVERSLDGVNFTPIGPSPTNSSFVDHDVALATTYHYRARATNSRGAGPYSTARTIVTPMPPSAPAALVATAQGSTEIRLSWTDTSSNEVGFTFEVFLDGAWQQFDDAPANATSYVFRFGSPSTSYSFRVYAYTDVLLSGASNIASATTLASNPGAVTGAAFNDPNGNGRADIGETPAAGLVVFYDASGNGVLDGGEPSVTVTSAVRNAPGTNLPYVNTPNYTLRSLPFGPRRICGSYAPAAGGASCRTVTILNGPTTPNVNFPVAMKKVGVATLTPERSRVEAGEVALFDLAWAHTDGLWVLLNNAVIRIVDDEDHEAIRLRFDEATRTFSVWDVKAGTFGPGVAAGQKVKLRGRDVRLHVERTQVIGTGPTGPSVVLRLALEFEADRWRREIDQVQIRLEDDRGYLQGFERIGRVLVVR